MADSPDELGDDSQPVSPFEELRGFSDQITQLKRRREELRERAELQQLQQEVEDMERRLAGEDASLRGISPSLDDEHTQNDLNERPAQRRRFDDDASTIVGRGPKIEPIPVFEGKGIREYYDFEARLQIAFRLDPSAFTLEDQKIAFTLQYLQPTFRQIWIQREQEDDGNTLSWRDMMSFLLDQIKSPVNRELQVTILYQKSMQKEGQSVNDFAAYLSTLENQINPPYEQKHLVMHLYSKLRPEIRVALSNYTEFPTTRRELVERAATLEDNLRRSGGLPAVPRRSSTPRRTVRESSRVSSVPPQRRTPFGPPTSRASHAGGKPNACYHCGGSGHWAKDCYKRKSNPGSSPTTGANSIRTKNASAQRTPPTQGR